MKVDVKSNFFDGPLRDPLRTFIIEGEPDISQTALYAKSASNRMQEISKTKLHA